MAPRKKLITVLITGALAVVAGVGLLGAQAVYAQTTTPTQQAPAQQVPGEPPNGALPGRPGMPGGQGMPGGRGGVSDADLAAALGITTDQLTAAYKTADAEAIKEAVSKGLITQAQADQMTANNTDGRHFGGRMLGGPNSGIDYNALLASALGITTDKLQAAYQQVEANRTQQAIANGTMTQAQADAIAARKALQQDTNFQSAMKSAYEAAVKQAVSSGVITQAQADALLQEASQSNGASFGPGFGGGHGGPDFNGAPGGLGAPAPTAAPTSGTSS